MFRTKRQLELRDSSILRIAHCIEEVTKREETESPRPNRRFGSTSLPRDRRERDF